MDPVCQNCVTIRNKRKRVPFKEVVTAALKPYIRDIESWLLEQLHTVRRGNKEDPWERKLNFITRCSLDAVKTNTQGVKLWKALTCNASIYKRHTRPGDHGSEHNRRDIGSSWRAYGAFLWKKTGGQKASLTLNQGEHMCNGMIRYLLRPPITIPSELKLANPQSA